MNGMRPASGLVTLVGVVNLLFAALIFIVAVMLVVGAPFIMVMFGQVAEQAEKTAEKLGVKDQGKDVGKAGAAAGGLLAGMLMVVAACLGILGVPYLLAGIGVLKRRNWGRILTFILAALAGLGAVYNATQGDLRQTPVLVNVLISGGYAVLCFVVLIAKGDEFNPPPQVVAAPQERW